MRDAKERKVRMFSVEDAIAFIEKAKNYAEKFGEATDDAFGNTSENVVRMTELAELVTQVRDLYGDCSQVVVCFTRNLNDVGLKLDIDSVYWKDKLQLDENDESKILYVKL